MSYPPYHSGEVPALNEIADRLEAQSLASGGGKDEINSTSVALGAGEEFTGEWVTNGSPQIAFNGQSDQPGTLYIEFSPDDGNTVTLSKPYTFFAGEPEFDALVKAARSHRIRYVNDGTAQTTFVLGIYTGSGLFPYVKSTRDEQKPMLAGGVNITTTTYKLLVDVSDRVNFPHSNVGSVNIHASYFAVDKTSNSNGSVQIGVITAIDGTSAQVAAFLGVSFTNASDNEILRDREVEVPYRCRVEDGLLSEVPVAPQTIAAINTGVTLETPYGTATPEVGDLVAIFNHTAGTYTAYVSGFYSTSV